jgi:hypothetical protein
MDIRTTVGYLNGFSGTNNPMGTGIVVILAIVALFLWIAVIIRWLRNRKKKAVQKDIVPVPEDKAYDQRLIDTPYFTSNNALPGGNPVIYWWENFRDWFMRAWFYNTITVIRLKETGKADHRAYIVKALQMNTINWDNCTYNVRERCLLPVRRNFLMVVIEGISEPLDLWNWAEIMKLIQDTYQKKLDSARLDDDLKLKIGKFTFDAREFYTKMNNRDMELMDMTSLPNLQVLYYASIIAAFGVILILAQNMGWLPSGMADRIADLRTGLVEVLKAVKELKPS